MGHCFLQVEERETPRGRATLIVDDDGFIEITEVGGGGAEKVRAALERRGLGENLMAGEPRGFDFEEEEAVLLEMSKELEVSMDDLEIAHSSLERMSGGTLWEVTLGNQEWEVARDYDQARDLAIAMVEQDLETDPEIFSRDFLARHIDEDRLRRELYSDVLNMREEDLRDEAERRPDDFWRHYERAGFDAPEEDEEGNRRDPEDSEIEELAEHETDEELRDPMQYLENIYGREDAVAQALEIAPINTREAAEDVVRGDGPGQRLSGYDGELHETPVGWQYWRTN
jgi:hypothetical protein